MNKPLKTGILTFLAAFTLAANAFAANNTEDGMFSPAAPEASNATYSAIASTRQNTPSETESRDASQDHSNTYASYLAFAQEKEEATNIDYGMILTESQAIYARPSAESRSMGTCQKGDVLRVLGCSGQWLRVEFADCKGYVESASVELGHTEDEYGPCDTMAFVLSNLQIYSSPDTATAQSLASCSVGQRLELLNAEVAPGWYKVRADGVIGYVSNTSLLSYPADQEGNGAAIISHAMAYIGTPYVYGGTSPAGFDCSGLVYYVYQAAGYNISRRASTIWNDGYAISQDQLQAGDPVFFSSSYSSSIEHVGLYIGNGLFIHSPSTGKCIQIDSLDYGYYAENYYGAVRIYGMD